MTFRPYRDSRKIARLYTSRNGWRGRLNGQTFTAKTLLDICSQVLDKGATHFRIGEETFAPEQITEVSTLQTR